ncbi:heterokaryon incompatibility protein-domain-containing protein, partial [Clohesyomyces aquaticus]
RVRCEIFSASLQGSDCGQKYVALSYTWGNPDQRAYIIANGARQYVRKNLERALSALRRGDQDVILWVDALCINQENLDERNEQVTLMANIYRNSEDVFIYLGETNPNISLAMDIMRNAEGQGQDTLQTWSSDTKDYIRLKELEPLDEAELRQFASTEGAKQGLQDLLSRPWFDRVWILQEAAHARSHRVFCGPRSASSRTLCKSIGIVRIVPKPHCQAVLRILEGGHAWWEKRDIASLLRRFRGSKATDERDKIYALLSMSSDAS